MMMWRSVGMQMALAVSVAFLLPSGGRVLAEVTDREKAAKEVAVSFVKELGAALMRR